MRANQDPVIGKYLSRYALLPALPRLDQHWHHVMVVPCFKESLEFLARIPTPPLEQTLLVIGVLNRPETDSDIDANHALRNYVKEQASSSPIGGITLCQLTPATTLLMIDLEHLEGATPSTEGVGRARRVGCDLALWLMQQGHIESEWIYSTDADAQWPSHYLSQAWPTGAAAISLPFQHVVDADTPLGRATLIYELWLHHYILGLELAASEYAFHTLGSCCGFHAHCYGAVRGVPLRAGAEDFYLLNKLAKMGQIYRPPGPPVLIQARASDRVPFGTGPAVTRLMASGEPESTPFFYHPECFTALQVVLASFPTWLARVNPNISEDLSLKLPKPLALAATAQLSKLGLPQALKHSQRNSRDAQQSARQLRTWFDGFKTLKFLNGLRELSDNHQSYQQLPGMDSEPITTRALIAKRQAITARWGWQLN